MRAEYTTVTEKNFQSEVLESPRPVIVEIKAEWSGASHIMAPVIDRISSRMGARCKVCVIDYDANGPIVRDYGVRTLPTILVFIAGTVVGRITGAISATVLEDRIDALLPDDCTQSTSQDHTIGRSRA